MTQKELLYFEDAIGHETSIIKILKDSIENLNDERLVTFMNSELSKHNELKQKLMNKLGEKVNG